MSLTAKFNGLTSEQQEAFGEVKSAEALDKFIADNNIILTDEEKSNVVEYIETGMMPLSDDDLDAVVGGKGNQTPLDKARAEGRPIPFAFGGMFVPCPTCSSSCETFMYASERVGIAGGGLKFAGVSRYDNCKCYNCNNTWVSLWVVVHNETHRREVFRTKPSY